MYIYMYIIYICIYIYLPFFEANKHDDLARQNQMLSLGFYAASWPGRPAGGATWTKVGKRGSTRSRHGFCSWSGRLHVHNGHMYIYIYIHDIYTYTQIYTQNIYICIYIYVYVYIICIYIYIYLYNRCDNDIALNVNNDNDMIVPAIPRVKTLFLKW